MVSSTRKVIKSKIQSLHLSEPSPILHSQPTVTESTERMLAINNRGATYNVPLSASFTELDESHDWLIQRLGSLASTIQSPPPSLRRAEQYQLRKSVRKGDRDFRCWNRLPTMAEEDYPLNESNRDNDSISQIQNYKHPLLDERLSSSSRDISPIQPQRQESLELSESTDTT